MQRMGSSASTSNVEDGERSGGGAISGAIRTITMNRRSLCPVGRSAPTTSSGSGQVDHAGGGESPSSGAHGGGWKKAANRRLTLSGWSHNKHGGGGGSNDNLASAKDATMRAKVVVEKLFGGERTSQRDRRSELDDDASHPAQLTAEDRMPSN